MKNKLLDPYSFRQMKIMKTLFPVYIPLKTKIFLFTAIFQKMSRLSFLFPYFLWKRNAFFS